MDVLRVARSLFESSASTSDQIGGGTEYLATEGAHDNTQKLRVVSIFVILASGLIGGLPPLFLKVFRDPDSNLTCLVRSFAAGVIAALALVHIIPEAVEEMTELGGVEYPLGGTCALGGIALMILLEHVAHIMHNEGEGQHAHKPHRAPSRAPSQSLCAVAAADVPSSPCGGAVAAPVASSLTGLPAAAAAAVCEGTSKPCRSYSGDLNRMESGGVGVGGPAVHGHSHVCVSRGPASNWLTAGAVEAMGSLRLKVVAYLFEMGCIFHSFIIGLSLGVNQTDLREVRSLLIALAFHQWLEGISLASVIIRGGFSLLKGAAMIATYSLTCPVGIAVGMAIAETYDAESTKSRAIQGAFNGVSGGMLLYISLVQLVAEDMGRLVPGRDSALGRMTCFAALCGGAASMCLLAVWA